MHLSFSRLSYRTFFLTGSALFLISLPFYADAQTVDIPGSADPGRAEMSVPEPEFGDVIMPRIDIPEIRIEDAPEGAENITFVLNDLVLEGVSAYPDSALKPIYDDYLGTTIRLTDVYAIAQSVTRKYRNDGYLITQAVIPQQTIEEGVVRIRVVEGYIDRVVIQNEDDSMASHRLRGLAEQLTKSDPLTAGDLERWLLLVNDIPGLSARSIISPSKTAIGGADITIIPDMDPYEFAFSVDNYGSRYLGPIQLSAAVQFNNLFNAADMIETQFVSGGGDELIYGYAAYEVPVNAYGTRLRLDITHSDTEPGHDLEIFEVEGYSTLFGIEAVHPFTRSRTENLYGLLRFDYRKLTSENIVDPIDRDDRIAALRAGLTYNAYDTVWRPAINEISLLVSQGLDILNASDEGDATLTRANGDPQFTKAEIELSRLQTVTNNFNILLGARGQIASDPLLSSEEFGIGGRVFGRGYDSSELVGDHGVAAKIELQWENPVRNTLLNDYQLFGFYDIGKIWNDDEIVSDIKKASLASAGFGLRADFTDAVSGEFVAAFPLTREVETRDSTDPRFFFSLSAEF